MQDRALHRLGALSGRQSCAIAKPVLPRTIPIGLDRTVRKNKVALINLGATIDLPAGAEGQGGEKRTCDRPFQHSPRHTELCDKPGLPPPPPPPVAVGAGASSCPDRRTRSRCAMYAASEWSGFESQNSEITSDSRLTLAATRAASLGSMDADRRSR